MNKPHMLNHWILGFGFLASALLVGCGTADEDHDAATTNDTGTLQIAITDAEEDFLTYRIDINSINLVREDGVEVSVLPATTDVDFVQYQELSELFASLAVPKGVYTSVALDLDYADADIVIQNDSGVGVSATAVDDEGATLSAFTVLLTFNDDEYLQVSPKTIAHVTLDLDLAASNTILSTDPAVVQVAPYMLATASVDPEREHRVRALLNSVDAETLSFNVDILPMRLRRGEFGSVDISVSDTTAYEVDGVEYTGAAGLIALAAKAQDTPVVSYGTRSETGFVASQVFAGSSVAWADKDVVKGVVTARSGSTLTLNGAVIETATGSARAHQEVSVTMADTTEVTGYRLGDADTATISVGQRVLVLGDLNEDASAVDASVGAVQMKANRITGEVTQASPLVMDLLSINKRTASVFDMSGTGVDAANDADVSAYEIDTATLNVSNITDGDWLVVSGYPTAFGAAPYDFDATSIVRPDLSSVSARYDARFVTTTDTPAVTVENQTLLVGDGFRERLHFKGMRIELSEQIDIVQIQGVTEGRFSLREGEARQRRRHHQQMDMYENYADFITALSAKLADGQQVSHLIASGTVDADSGVLTADHITMTLK